MTGINTMSKTNGNKIITAVDNFDTDKKREFIEVYEKTNGHISDTCRAVGISRQTYYNHLDTDKEFALKVADKEAHLNDEIRNVLIAKAAEGDMTAVIFYLKKRHPDFKDQPGMYQQNNFFTQVINEDRERYR